MYVRVVRTKFVKRGQPDAGVLTAPVPELPIERGLAGPAQLAQVVIDKFEDHQALSGQERQFERNRPASPWLTNEAGRRTVPADVTRELRT